MQYFTSNAEEVLTPSHLSISDATNTSTANGISADDCGQRLEDNRKLIVPYLLERSAEFRRLSALRQRVSHIQL